VNEGDFELVVSILIGFGTVLTGLGIAQVLSQDVTQLLQKTLPLLTTKVTILTINIPAVSIIGVVLIALTLLMVRAESSSVITI